MIYDILREFYHEAAGRTLLTGKVIDHQTFADMLRWNPHFLAIVLEGGFDNEGTFFYLPFSGLQSMVEVFRRRVANLLVERNLLNENFARNLLSWKHSGFSIDNSVRMLDESAQESPAEYIARPLMPKTWVMNRCRTKTKRLVLTHANAPGPAIGLRAAVVAALLRNLVLECRFGLAL